MSVKRVSPDKAPQPCPLPPLITPPITPGPLDDSMDPSGVKMEVPARRPMRYPYTLTAKIVQFPLRYYMANVWMWKYFFGGVGLSLIVFYKLERLSKRPENVAKWNEIKRKTYTPGAEH